MQYFAHGDEAHQIVIGGPFKHTISAPELFLNLITCVVIAALLAAVYLYLTRNQHQVAGPHVSRASKRHHSAKKAQTKANRPKR